MECTTLVSFAEQFMIDVLKKYNIEAYAKNLMHQAFMWMAERLVH